MTLWVYIYNRSWDGWPIPDWYLPKRTRSDGSPLLWGAPSAIYFRVVDSLNQQGLRIGVSEPL